MIRPRRVLRPLVSLIAAAVCSVGLAACGGGGAREPEGMVLRLPQPSEPTVWDPATVTDGPTIEVLMHLFDGLVQWNEKNEIVPGLAEKWEISDGGRTYTFHLRPGAKFHNGRPVTASDFVFSLNRALNPKTRSPVASTYLNDIVGATDVLEGRASAAAGISAPNDRTLVLKIDRPRVYFLAKLTYPTAYVVAQEALEQDGSLSDRHVIGTGPFKLQQFLAADRIILAANPDYYQGRPKIDRIERRIMTSAEQRRQMYDAGEVDMVDVPMADYERDRGDAKLKEQLRIFDRASVYYFAFNERFPPFKNRRVRRAFTMAIDRDRIVRDVLLGVPERAKGILPKGVPGYDPEFAGLPFDPAAAKAELAAAGFPDGQGFPTLTLSFREGMPDIRRVCEVAEQDLRANLGVSVRLNQMEYGELLRRRAQDDMPFYFLRWAADYLDPQDFLSVMLRTGAPENRILYSNPAFDRLCDQGDVDPESQRRLGTYRKAEQIAVDDAAWGPVFFQKDVELWNPRVKGVRDCLMGHLPYITTTVE